MDEAPQQSKLVETPNLRDRDHVYADRADAGRVLAELLEPRFEGSNALILAVPAGGAPVAGVIAERLQLEMDYAVVSKIALPWTTESGYGAVAFDGSVYIEDDLVRRFRLSRDDVDQAVHRAEGKVEQRVARLRGRRPFPEVRGRPVILVDDGLAAGATMTAAIAALRDRGADQLFVAVPTGHLFTCMRIADLADGLFCPNVRGGASFAVADAYQRWRDISLDELDLL